MAATPDTQVSIHENQQTQQPKIQIYPPCNDEVSDFWRGYDLLAFSYSLKWVL